MKQLLLIDLGPENAELVEQELKRLKQMYDIKILHEDFIALLVEQHKLKLQLAEEQVDSEEALAWLWRKNAKTEE